METDRVIRNAECGMRNSEFHESGRILHIIDHLIPSSGVASVVMLCVTVITQVVQDVAVYGQCDAKMEEAVVSHGGKVHRLPDVTKSLGIPFSKAFSKLLQKQQYTAIHGHLLNSAFIYMRQAKRHGVPLRIIHSHNTLSAETTLKRFRNNILNLGIPLWANRFIAVSEGAAKCAFGNSRKAMSDVKIIYNGIDTSRFRYDSAVRSEVRSELEISETTICIGHVGRFAKQKNHVFLLEVFQSMLKQADCLLLLVGKGPLEDSIKAKARDMGISNSILFLGSRSDAERIYQAFDVFLLPSLFEGFGIVAVEAQCTGLGCVVADCVPQAVKSGDNIRFLPLGDVSNWSKTALELAKTTRTDDSVSVKKAGLDNKTMCEEIARMYEVRNSEFGIRN